MAKSPKRISAGTQALPWLRIYIDAFDAMIEGNARAARIWLETWQDLSGEVATFTTRRLNDDGGMVRRFCKCKTAADVMALQADFYQRMVGDYMRESTKLADMETDVASSEIAEMTKGVHKATEIVAAHSRTTGAIDTPATH